MTLYISIKIQTLRNLFTTIFIATCSLVLAQKNIDPTPEEIALAVKWRGKHPTVDLLERNYREKVTFFDNANSDGVGVLNEIKANLMSLSKRLDMAYSEGYDQESAVEVFKILHRNGKSTRFEIRDEYYKSDGLFYNDFRVKWAQIDFPVQGYNYLVETATRYKDARYFSKVYLSGLGLRANFELEFIIPKNIEISLLEYNFPENQIQKKETVDEQGNRHILYSAAEILPRINEDDAPGDSYLFPHIIPVVKAITKNGVRKALFENGDAVYAWNKSMIELTENKPKELKPFVDDLVKGLTKDEDKIKKMYYWVQDNIRYIAFEDGIAGFKPDEAQNVFNKRYGDCKGMANLLAEMLKLQGYDARLAWIGTDHIAYKADLPALAAFNHMICYLKINNKEYFLDGTESYTGLGLNASRIQGKEVLVDGGAKPLRTKVPVSNHTNNTSISKGNFKVEGEKLVGKMSRAFDGESRTNFFQQFHAFANDFKSENLTNYLKRYDKNIEIKDLVFSDLNNRDQTLKLDFEVIASNKVNSYEGELYVEFPYETELNLELLKDRKLPFVFEILGTSKTEVIIENPPGYQLVKLPESFSVANDIFEISVKFTPVTSGVKLESQYIIKQKTLPTNQFKNYEETAKKYNQKIRQTLTYKK